MEHTTTIKQGRKMSTSESSVYKRMKSKKAYLIFLLKKIKSNQITSLFSSLKQMYYTCIIYTHILRDTRIESHNRVFIMNLQTLSS